MINESYYLNGYFVNEFINDLSMDNLLELTKNLLNGKLKNDWYWEEKYKKEHKLRQEVEGELTIVKTITIDSSPEMRNAKAKIKELQDSLDRFKKENNECYNRIADLTESLKSKDYFEKPDYKFLVNENHRLEQQYLEVMADNKKLAQQVEDKMNELRKSGF